MKQKNNPVYNIFIARLKCFESLNLQLKYMHWVILSPFLCFRWVFWCWTNSFQSVCSMLLYCQSQVWKFCFCHFWKKKNKHILNQIKVCKSFFFFFSWIRRANHVQKQCTFPFNPVWRTLLQIKFILTYILYLH